MTPAEKFLEEVRGTVNSVPRYPPTREQLSRMLRMVERRGDELTRVKDLVGDQIDFDLIQEALDYDGK